MLLAGDEIGKSQSGNNNPYCQDSPLTWIDWASPSDPALHDFTAAVLHLRRTNKAFRRESFFTGTWLPDRSRKDVTWLRPDGEEMTESDWHDTGRRVIGLLFGDEQRDPDDRLFLMYLNAHDAELTVVLPPKPEERWELLYRYGRRPALERI
jgi:isoamylase